MYQIRQGVFETNSSSTHSLCICTKKEYEDLPNKEDYHVLAQENNKVYVATVDSSSELAISAEEMKNSFKVI